jgi:hypothetical protein
MSVGTVTIQVSPQAAAALRHLQTQAAQMHLSFETYLESLVKPAEREPIEQSQNRPLSPEEKIAHLNKWIAGLKRDTPLLSDEAISRESIYAHETAER